MLLDASDGVRRITRIGVPPLRFGTPYGLNDPLHVQILHDERVSLKKYVAGLHVVAYQHAAKPTALPQLNPIEPYV